MPVFMQWQKDVIEMANTLEKEQPHPGRAGGTSVWAAALGVGV